jgi:hypothetical protein
MITSGRRPKRPDGKVYRTMRRQAVSGRSLLEISRDGSSARPGRESLLRRTAKSLRFLLTIFR